MGGSKILFCWTVMVRKRTKRTNQPMLRRLYLPKSRILNIRLEQLECHMHTLFILCDNPSHHSILNHMKVDDKTNVKTTLLEMRIFYFGIIHVSKRSNGALK